MSREATIEPAADALPSAVRFLRRGVRPDGTHEDGSDWEIASHQWGLFISWSYNRGVSLPATVAPDREGGREHDLRFDADTGRWLKFTKPFSAGWAVEWNGERLARRGATPLQYLQRWRLLNRLFDGGTRLVGLSCLGRTQRVVVSQKHHQGTIPTREEIDATMQRLHGLWRLPENLSPPEDPERRAYARGRLVLFDVQPSNCARMPDGRIVPFGAIPQFLSRMDALALQRGATR